MGSSDSKDKKGTIEEPEFLINDDELVILNGEFQPIAKQNDDMVVYYAIKKNRAESRVWISNDWNVNFHGAFQIQTRDDNTLVMYYANNNDVVWSLDLTKTAEAKYFLVIESEKRIMITEPHTGRPIRLYNKADSGKSVGNQMNIRERLKKGYELTSKNGIYHAVFQYNGDVVIYKTFKFKPTNIIWKSNTASVNPRPSFFSLKEDGNLTLYDVDSKACWSSKILVKPNVTPQKLVLEDDGFLVIYDEYKKKLWSSKEPLN
jgi:phage pi2 protein 07